ncbi:Atu2307/SP_0267 family LLM class monooxygenase [Deinococcus cellulosilyticus]|uniref:Luciferase n=1 Tax=Deinococcus cellulosilyticus (strain DSM 18568 / NBRC 106333 / KACC 11606 / 5516J-15) TaxID=1223518 RepID=A0A511N7C7_DEIC1|nr:Atu2307/SP_0267 family LLM class monooxygenase [Deinococcus cellulosilyticus]GEM48378.1 luciferase [Deinococcus cellulosilyticus NBRC 106333 = KACC 11606]
MEIGIDSFAAVVTDPDTGTTLSGADRLNHLIEEIETADRAGVDSFGIGEHHRKEYLDSAPTLILAAAASRTNRIRLTSAVTVLSADDPVRVFQQFATLDLLSRGRAEIVAGRGSSIEAYPLFGLDLNQYDPLFREKLDLLLKLRDNTHLHWQGQFRAPLTGHGVYPRPHQTQLPIWVGVGGTPASFVRAGTLGLPLMVAIIGGDFRRFRPLIDLYRQAGERAGHPREQLKVGVHAFGFVAETGQVARDLVYPGYERLMNVIGRERGWPPASRARFDHECGPSGAYLTGSVEEVVEKAVHVHQVLGGVSRLTFQMTNVMLNHDRMLQAIEMLGQQVRPRVQERLAQLNK